MQILTFIYLLYWLWFINQTWNDVDGVHHGFDIWQVSEWCVKFKTCSQREVKLLFGKLLDSSGIKRERKTSLHLDLTLRSTAFVMPCIWTHLKMQLGAFWVLLHLMEFVQLSNHNALQKTRKWTPLVTIFMLNYFIPRQIFTLMLKPNTFTQVHIHIRAKYFYFMQLHYCTKLHIRGKYFILYSTTFIWQLS